jgi:hypothetical protein
MIRDPRDPMRLRPRSFTATAIAIVLMPLACEAQSRQARQPTHPPPSITEYQPRSTRVVPPHEVTRAKLPVVDFHGHTGNHA